MDAQRRPATSVFGIDDAKSRHTLNGGVVSNIPGADGREAVLLYSGDGTFIFVRSRDEENCSKFVKNLARHDHTLLLRSCVANAMTILSV